MRRLMETLAVEQPRAGRFRVVRITAVGATTCEVEYINGVAGTGRLSDVRRLQSYTPAVGDNALLWSDGAFQILVGAIA